MPEGKSPTRLFVPAELAPGRTFALPSAQAHHALAVLRMRSGDSVVLFNGDGAEYDAVIEAAARRAVSVEIRQRRVPVLESGIEIVLGQALSSGERMDYTIQKAVELGASAIHPLAAARSVVRLDGERAEKRAAHWRAVAIATCEQCGRNRVPPVAPVAALEAWLAQPDADGAPALRVLLSPRGTVRLRDLHAPTGSVWLLAGPEGGFTQDEEDRARAAGYTPTRLGPRVLRTETAALAALAAMQTLWGDF